MYSTQYLGPTRHPAIGIRIPEIFLTGILRAYKKRNVAGGFMLSFGRETAPESVIEAAPGHFEITRGHTGTSIKRYITMGADSATSEGMVVEIEADHLIVIGSSSRAVKRIAGVHEGGAEISEEELERSMQYNLLEVDEALSTGHVNCFTVDTSDLFDLRASSLSVAQLRAAFERTCRGSGELLGRYAGRRFAFAGKGKNNLTVTEPEAMRLALKYGKSILVNGRIYDYIAGRMGMPFGFEISLDETKDRTKEVELLFYLNEWKKTGRHADFVAPNIGFRKRMDFSGDLKSLEEHVARLSAIARSFGVLLSIHSGSGTTPYSGKGVGTYGALLRGSGGRLKYKISGVYYELLLQILASFPSRSKERALYNEIFDSVYRYLGDQVRDNGPLASQLLERQLTTYRRQLKEEKAKARDPRAAFFRFNSYLALNLRDERGRRRFRGGLVRHYGRNLLLKGRVDRETERLTLRLIDGLRFSNNVEDMPVALRQVARN
jgi:hypothetical protein